MSYPRSAMENDLETIKILYHSGLKNLNDFTNIEGRNIGHIVSWTQAEKK